MQVFQCGPATWATKQKVAQLPGPPLQGFYCVAQWPSEMRYEANEIRDCGNFVNFLSGPSGWATKETEALIQRCDCVAQCPRQIVTNILSIYITMLGHYLGGIRNYIADVISNSLLLKYLYSRILIN